MAAGRKVLIVEDEWLIAEDLKQHLEDLGCEVLGPAPSCSAALEVLWASPPDVAFLDTQLGSETCEVVLEECLRQGVPVVISSGHSKKDLPAFCRDLPTVGKPFSQATIAGAVAAVLPGG